MLSFSSFSSLLFSLSISVLFHQQLCTDFMFSSSSLNDSKIILCCDNVLQSYWELCNDMTVSANLIKIVNDKINNDRISVSDDF